MAFLQGVDSVYDIEWTPGVKYRDVRYNDELQYSVYNFEMADVPTLWKLFEIHEAEGRRLARFEPFGFTGGVFDPGKAEINPDFPYTLDLRRESVRPKA